MLDKLKARIEELKQQFKAHQDNIKELEQRLEHEKSMAFQTIGHFNEATHLHNEFEKSLKNEECNEGQKGQEVYAKCSETGEQGQVA